jgi:flagellar biosynthesis protein FlhA
MGNTMSRRLSGLTKYTEAWLALLLFMILALIIVPMPTHLVDMLIALNLTMSVVIMLTAMYITRALDFSVFPAMLLVTTLLRISLSIAATRLILSNTADRYHEGGTEGALGAAGDVIQAFGNFVVKGNAVIGIIIFVIITIVQFVIVAQGAGRVAEVAARFTLDAMPGKQMALDGEFNNRMISAEDYKLKRAELQAENDFFGAMDGAMKFVKGDAMAGIMIVMVNIIGGFVVGGLMNGMPFGVAGSTFTVLTVGEGLISQLPSLLISVAAGLVVTRAAAPVNMGSALGGQLLQSPRALAISSIIVGALGLVPGLPKVPLLTLAIAVGGAAWFINKRNSATAAIEGELGDPDSPEQEISPQVLRVDPISLEVGEDLERMADPELGPGELLERLKQVRKRIAMEFGVIAPGVRVRPHRGLSPGGYQIRLKGDLIAEGEVMIDHVLGIGRELEIPGLDAELTYDPIYNTPALWIEKHQQALAEENGLQTFDSQDVVSTHVAEIIKSHLDELLTREEVSELLNMARQDSPTVVAELVPQMLTVGQVRTVLQNLVREQVPVKDMATILNTLADQVYHTKDPFSLTEQVRAALSRKICQRYQSPDGTLKAFTLSPAADQTIGGSIQMAEGGSTILSLDPATNTRLHENLQNLMEERRGEILDPVIVCNPRIRRYVKKLYERTFSKLVVLSYAEIAQGVHLQNLGEVDIH